MIASRIQSLCALGLLALACLWPQIASAQAPIIVVPPTNLSVTSGANATLSVQATGATPFIYRWQLFGTNLPGRTNATLSLTNINLNNGGIYSVIVTNSSGAVTSALALVNIDEDLTFRILQLQTNGAIAVESGSLIGDDRGGLVVGPNFALQNGDSSLVRFGAGDMSGQTAFGFILDALCSDLRTEKIYSLANGTTLLGNGGGNVTALVEIDEGTGQPNGGRVNLSTNISMTSGGIFSGYGRVVLWNGSAVFDIAIPSGRVTPRGTMGLPRTVSENWGNTVAWGLAEYFTNTLQLVYVLNDGFFPYRNIVRSRVGTGSTPTLVQQFTSLSEMANLSFSTSRSRWYFHYEGSGQFFPGGDEIMGSAKALFTTNGRAPFIYRNPQGQTNYPGSNATFTVQAAGHGPFTYQWRFNGNNIAGATGPSLTIGNLDFFHTGNYSVEIGNNSGGVVSGDAFLFVVSQPQILAEPQTISALAGTNVSFTVGYQAAPPVSLQWYLNGSPLPNATNATYTVDAVTAANVGDYRVIITNRYGSSTSAVARLLLIVEAAFSFKILNLGNDAVLQEHISITGDDRGGLAVSSNRVIVGGDIAPGMFSAANLSGGVPLSTPYDSLVSDLRTEKIYSLGTGTNFYRTLTTSTSFVVNTFIEINGNTGVRTTNVIALSQPIPMSTAFGVPGLFSGYGQVVIHSGTRVYSIALPSGVVADLGAMPTLQRQSTESWAYYGIAENFGGSVYLAYVQDFQSIVRARVPDALVTTVGNFLNLSDMASINASVSRGRWYFHFENSSQFGGSNQTVGYCSASFSVTPNAVVDHFTWEPLPGAQFAGVPFTASITARTLLETVVSNFSGTVAFSAFSTFDGSAVTVLPGTSLNFSNGAWTGELTLPNPVGAVVLRATDVAGRFGFSEPFSVVTTNDLALYVGSSTNAATQYKAITFQLLLTNSGPASATAIFATNILPENINLVSVTPSQGSCSVNAGTVVCDVGTLASGGSTLIDIVVVPTGLGTLTNTTQIVRGEAEEHLENNAATNVVSVTLPKIVVNDASEIEGSSSLTRGTNIFTVQLNTTSAVPVYVQFTTAPGTALTSDYVTRSGLITFAPGVTETNIRVSFAVDTLYEANEFFFLNFFSVTNATLVRTQAIGTIINDDPQPSLIVANAAFNEGNSGSATVSVPVQLSTSAGVPISINYATSNGTAIAGSDYNSRSGILYFTNGVTSLFVPLSIIGDTLGESNDFFYVRLFNGTNINVNTQIVVAIMNDDPANVLHHFSWSTIAPTQGIDVPFNATVAAKDVVDRTLTNYNASLRLSLVQMSSGGSGHVITNNTGASNFFNAVYTIGFGFRPAVDIYLTHVRHISGTKVSIWEEDGRLVVAQNVTQLTNGVWQETPVPAPIRLLAGRTYRIGGYNGAPENPWYSGNVLPAAFAHGVTTNAYFQSGDLFPDIDLGNSLYMVDFSYSLSLFPFSMSPTNVALTNGVWSGPVRALVPGESLRIFASDPNTPVSSGSNPFDVSLSDDLALQITPSANPTPTNESLTFFITLSNAGPTLSTGVKMTNQLPSNATYGSAFTDHGSVTAAAGQVIADVGTLTNGEVATIAVTVFPTGAGAITNSASAGRNEAELFLANNSQVAVVNATALGISLTDFNLFEGHNGTTDAIFIVSLSAVSTQTVSVAFSTLDSSAVAGEDFQGTNGVLVFPPGTTKLPVAVRVYGDLINEFDEGFLLRLAPATNATITRSFGFANIFNDDPLPMISVADVTVNEGRSGLTPVTFTLTVSPPSGRTVSVNAATLDASATVEDYDTGGFFVQFSPGQSSTNLTVFVHGDSDPEPDEYFLLRLSGPGNATLAVAEARGNIINDDVAGSPGVLHHFEWSAVPSPQTIERSIDVTLTARDGVGAVFPFNGVLSLTALAGTNSIAIQPGNTGPLVNGVWSGTVTFSNAATNVVLVAEDGAGHNGISDPFNVNVANIALSVSAPPQALIYSPFTYSILVSNAGPNAATAISVTNALPPDLTFVDASSSGGGCVFADGVVACDAGALDRGQIGLVSISVSSQRGGLLTNLFFGAAFEFDPVPTNNSALRVVEITGDNDHDGLPDVWEDQNGLSSIDATDANQDPDHDGHTSLQEFVAGTDPNDPESVLRAVVTIQSSEAQVRFLTVIDKSYVVEAAPSPAGPWLPIATELIGDGDTAIVFDSDFVTNEQRFYRVRVQR
jgi:uncharacterized repeat protein (TIGR01451 family)